MRARARESGRILVLTVGFFVVIGLLTVAVVDTSAAYLKHRELANLADSLALYASEGIDEGAVYAGTGEVRLSAERAQAQVAAHVPADVRWRLDVSDDRAHVRVERDFKLPISVPGWPATTTLTAEASSAIVLR